jgi:benzoate-CoA ligase family protein
VFEPPGTFNIADHFLRERIAEGRGGRTAIREQHRELTYAEVDRLADAYGRALRDAGVQQEQRVVIALPDGSDFVSAFFGALRIGAVVVMVNPGLPREQLRAILGYSRAPAVVVGAGTRETIVAAAEGLRRPPTLLEVAEVGDDQGGAELETVPTHRDDPAIWLFSGGTTGAPKAVVQTHRSFANTTERYAEGALGYREDDITIAVPKLYFGYATGSNLLFPFAVGASCVLFPDHPTPEILFELIQQHRATILVNVPSMVAKLVDHPRAAEQDLSSLRFATSAGEALPAALYHRWKGTFGVELLDGLGTAEMWHIFVTNLPEQVMPGTLGRAVDGFDVEVRDAAGQRVPDGEVGQLWVRGGSRALGYWQDLPRTMRTFRGEWVVTGDLIRRGSDGTVTYVGRSDDALKVKGKWLVPSEVEGVLATHSSVAEAAVVAVPDEDGLLRPVAFVVAEPGVARDDAGRRELAESLRHRTLERLEPYKHPREVHVVDGLPRTHLGKVDRGALRQRLSG